MGQTNYIHHLNAFFEAVFLDDRFHPTHIALYLALFQFWNQNRFAASFSVARADLMSLSKIKSKTTYSKCLGDLHLWGYILYDRSHNPLAKSRFGLVNIWEKGWPQSGEKGNLTGPLNGPVVVGSSPKNGLALDQSVPKNGLPLVPLYKTYKHKHINKETPPIQKLVVEFFKKENSSSAEAMKFWNHYQATGWKIGSAEIIDWRAVANKWLIGNKQRNDGRLVQKMDHLHVTKDKSYDDPL